MDALGCTELSWLWGLLDGIFFFSNVIYHIYATLSSHILAFF
jgi:hypothetical protein